MDDKIGSIDNDGNITTDDNSYNEGFNDMTAPTKTDEAVPETDSYDAVTTYEGEANNEPEEFDVFGNSTETKTKIDKKFIIIPIVIVIIIILCIIIWLYSSNKYTVKTKSLVIKVDQTAAIEISASSSVKDKLTCQSEDEEIAVVDDDCNVTGVTIGTTTIYVGKNGKKSKEVTVKVETNKEDLVLEEETISIAKGDEYQLKITNVLDDDVFEWTSSNEVVATVTDEGVVTGVHAGTTTIVVTESDGRRVTAKVTVTATDEVLIEKMSLEAQTIAIGESVTLKPTITPSNGLAILTWKSSKEEVATVDENGKVTGVSAGTTTITVESHNGKKATTKITVDDSIPNKITLSNCSGSVVIGSPITLTVNYSPSTASSKITWTSSDTSIATVSGGKVTGKAVGSVKITATTANGKTATCSLKVTATAVTSLKASVTSVTLDQNATKKVSITFTPSSAKQYYTVSWKSSNTSVATVSSDGTITGVGAGTATVTASAGGKSVSISVTVNATEVTKVTISGCESSGKVGNTLTLSATASPSTAKNATIKWSSSDTSIAKVSSGKVTYQGKGTVTITASTSNGTSATCKIKVIGPDITSLSADTSISLAVGKTKTITATTNLSSSNFNKYYTMSWSTTDSSIASISVDSSNSLKITVTGKKAGVATIHGYVSDDDGSVNSLTIQVTITS